MRGLQKALLSLVGVATVVFIIDSQAVAGDSKSGSTVLRSATGLGMFIYNRGWVYGMQYWRWQEPEHIECPTIAQLKPPVHRPGDLHYDEVKGECDCSRTEPTCPLTEEQARTRHPKVTFVTALYDIGRADRTACQYLEHMNNLLSVHVNLVVYTHPALVPTIRRIRDGFGLLNKTIVRGCRRENIPYWSLRAEMQSVMYWKTLHNLVRAWPGGVQERMIAEYDLIQHAKVDFVVDATQQNWFGSEFFFWVDAGAGKSHPIFHDHWCPCTGCLRDKVTMMQQGPAWQHGPDKKAGSRNERRRVAGFLPREHHGLAYLEYYLTQGWLNSHYTNIIGTFWGGGVAAVLEYQALYNSTVRMLLQKGIADDDQPVMEMCYWQRPALFNLVPGSFFDGTAALC